MNPLSEADREAYRVVHSRLRARWLDPGMILLTRAGTKGAIWFALALGLLIDGSAHARTAAVLMAAALLLAEGLINWVLKPIFRRDRPYQQPGLARLLVSAPGPHSWPSAHAGSSAAAAIVLSAAYPLWSPLFILVALLIAYSRVYVGVHYPLDVLAGIAVGIVSAAAVLLAATLVMPALHRSPPDPSVAGVRYHNPVFARDFPDPFVLRLGRHDYYAYGTVTSWERGYFPILHSRDAVHWKYVGDIFSLQDRPIWSEADFWAPDVIHRGRTFYAYVTGHLNNAHCIGVATASSPVGPFKDRGVVTCASGRDNSFIDPDPFIAPNGTPYLYMSTDSPHRIAVLKLKPSLLRPETAARDVLTVSQRWETAPNGISTVEGPYVFVHGGRYYLLYSGNDYTGNYAEGFATSSSPLGPFKKCTCNPVLRGDSKVHGPGGGSVFEGPDGRLWLAYHARNQVRDGDRNLRIDPLVWYGSRLSIPVTP